MRFSVNVEFTDDELRKYAEDVGRRWTQNAIHEVIKHLGAFKAPGVSEALTQAFSSVFRQVTPQDQADPGPMATGSRASSGAEHKPNVCTRVEANDLLDHGWVCCRCGTYNGLERSVCRVCVHGRCDIVVTPPPSATSSDSGAEPSS